MTVPPQPIQYGGAGVDLSTRFVQSSAVVGSPAAGSITSICTLTIPTNLVINSGVWLTGWAAFTAGTNAVSATLAIRQTSTSGTVVATTGAVTVVATQLYSQPVLGFDTAAVLPGQVYVLALTMGSGSATSTVSAVLLTAFII